MTKEELFNEIQRLMGKPMVLPHEAAAIGYYIFLLLHKLELRDDREIQGLRSKFIASLTDWDLCDIVERQMNYTIRIIEHPSSLEIEEIYKVFHLCDEIYGLEQIGLSAQPELKEAYSKSLKHLFSKERRRARIAAEDTVDDWSRNLWWYEENLSS